MTVTIQLSDEQLAALRAQAEEEGLSVAAWLQRLAEQYAQSRIGARPNTSERPVWELVSQGMRAVPEEVFERLPQDGASEHDHYLYGSPKRN
jgi:hypothetical protein